MNGNGEKVPFVPKQSIPYNADLMDELQGRVSNDVAAEIVRMIPPLASTSVIHDNGCGTGAVTEAVMDASPPKGISIQGTDVMQMYIDEYNKRAIAEDWPASASNMDAKDLSSFSDGKFTHSIGNFMFMVMGDQDVQAVQHIHRTLKSGGIVVLSLWELQPHITALKAASKAVRGPDSPPPWAVGFDNYQGAQIREALIKGGFEEPKIRWEKVTTYLTVKDPQKWCTLAWSVLGAPTGFMQGWEQRDEDMWDQAIDKTVEVLTDSKWCHVEDDGMTKVRMVADVVIAEK